MKKSLFWILALSIGVSVLTTGCATPSRKLASSQALSDPEELRLPNGESGIGFDDMRFAAGLNKVLVSGGRSGNLAIIDPSQKFMMMVPGFSAKSTYDGSHDDGVTPDEEAEQ